MIKFIFAFLIFLLISCNNDEDLAQKAIDNYIEQKHPEFNVFENIVTFYDSVPCDNCHVVHVVTLEYNRNTTEQFYQLSDDFKFVEKELTTDDVNEMVN